MGSAQRAKPEVRYGSPADMASFTGLSIKTIRRMIDAGKIPGHKVGRRVLIPYEGMERHILRIEDHMSATTSARTVPTRARIIMPGGAPVPRTPEEVRARAPELARALDALDEMGDEAEQTETLAFLMEALNADRLSDRARFP